MQTCLSCGTQAINKFCEPCVSSEFTLETTTIKHDLTSDIVMGHGYDEISDWGSHGRLIGINKSGQFLVLDEDGGVMNWDNFDLVENQS